MSDPSAILSLLQEYERKAQSFLAAYAAGYNSQACHDAYNEQEDALDAAQEALLDFLRRSPAAMIEAFRRIVEGTPK